MEMKHMVQNHLCHLLGRGKLLKRNKINLRESVDHSENAWVTSRKWQPINKVQGFIWMAGSPRGLISYEAYEHNYWCGDT